ncbi:hypothetical protein [Christiangramia sp.]|uniref:hypothetical protein n=1 Tax=Christiangramia sp. TaxID=1931228 RepID=UPI00261F4B14|nr:hypothetical protein [Christiangramia sp.]
MEPDNKELACIEYVRNYYSSPQKWSFFRKLFNLRPRKLKSDDVIVSKNKTFAQLWKDHGLAANYSVDIMQRYNDKTTCIKFWAETLYSHEIDIEGIHDSIIKERTKFAEETKGTGLRMIYADPIDVVPNKIDEMYGNYKKDFDLKF